VEGSVIFGKSTTVIPASLNQILAFLWHFHSRARKETSDLERSVVESINIHHKIGYVCQNESIEGNNLKIPRSESVHSLIWKRLDYNHHHHHHHQNRTIILSGTPTIHKNRPKCLGRERIEMSFVVKLEQLNKGRCKMTHSLSLDKGQLTGDKKITAHYVKNNLKLAEFVQQYFQKTRRLELLDAWDGKAMAEIFASEYNEQEMNEAKQSKQSLASIRVKSVTSSHVALKQFGVENLWFSHLMTAVISNKLRLPFDVESRLVALTAKEARTLGNNFASILASSTTPALAVEEWVLASKAMYELDKSVVWFRPMMVSIASRLLARVLWGAKFRLYFSAALSIMDLLTDIQVIYFFYKTGSYNYALINIAFIASNLLVQLLLAYAQNRKMGLKIMLKEMLIVILMVKPAVAAHRTAGGSEKLERKLAEDHLELTFTKCVDMVFESIPSMLLQTYHLLGDTGNVSKRAVLSIMVSASSIAFTSATISSDFDTDPKRRLDAPDFYG